MLLETAVGDALGAGYEYNNKAMDEYAGRWLHGYIQHGKHTGIKPGMYTDDTQMSIAIAEAMLSGEKWSPELIVKHFLAAFLRDPRDGYARGFQAFLETKENQTVDGFLANIRPDSDKSGAAMRAGVIGFEQNMGRVIEMATVQAEVTHRTKGGVWSAQAAALMVWFFRHTVEPRKNLPMLLSKYVTDEYPWTSLWHGKVGVKGMECVAAAITAVLYNNRMSEVLTRCIGYRGDVDTVAAIALGAASQCGEIEQDLPKHLIDGLENGDYGRDYIIGLDKLLEARE